MSKVGQSVNKTDQRKHKNKLFKKLQTEVFESFGKKVWFWLKYLDYSKQREEIRHYSIVTTKKCPNVFGLMAPK